MKKFTPGFTVYIVERDEFGDPVEVSGYMFLAAVEDLAVIVTPFINELESLEETLDYHIKETAEDYDTDLAVFPWADCYQTKYGAEEAIKEELAEVNT